jgi:hypothetical protein
MTSANHHRDKAQLMTHVAEASPEDFATWLRQVHRGCKVVFWFLILPVFATNAVAFCFPFIGLDSSHLKWARLLHTAGGVPLLWGAFQMTVPCPHPQIRDYLAASPAFVRTFAVVVLAERIVMTTLEFTVGLPKSLAAAIVGEVVFVATLLVGADYLRRLARGLGGVNQVRVFWVFEVGLVLLTGLYWAEFFRLDLQGYQGELAAMAVHATCFGPLYLVGLFSLLQVGRLARRAVRNECSKCGYSLIGSPGPRCPECGQQFMWLDGDQAAQA